MIKTTRYDENMVDWVVKSLIKTDRFSSGIIQIKRLKNRLCACLFEV